jgi:membrane protease YdiL (CAAX protease family)
LGWIYNRARGSILVPVLLHASMNSMNQLGDVLPMTTSGNVILISLTLIIILVDRMWQKLPSAHPAVYSDEIESGIGSKFDSKLES